eukprot:2296851-Rhodomonas_salina.1
MSSGSPLRIDGQHADSGRHDPRGRALKAAVDDAGPQTQEPTLPTAETPSLRVRERASLVWHWRRSEWRQGSGRVGQTARSSPRTSCT